MYKRQPFYQQQIQDYFNNNPIVDIEYPLQPAYRIASEIGLHAEYSMGKSLQNALFVDVNIAQLQFEQFFVIGTNDPFNQTLDPITYEQVPLFGNENRFYFNLGLNLSLYQTEQANAYFTVFASMNNTQMRRNYFVLGDFEYEIFHRSFDRPDLRLGGIGFGGGTGIGFKYDLTEHLVADFYYNLYYVENTLNDSFEPYGIQNALGTRIF